MVVKEKAIVDVTNFGFKFFTVAHDVPLDERVVDDIVELVDVIGPCGVYMVSDDDFFSRRIHRMVHLGMEIAYVVEITHHLSRRILGFFHVVIDGCPAEFLVHPSPNFAVGSLLRLVINPSGYVGLETSLIRFEGDIVRQSRLADFGLFLFDDDIVFLYQVFPLRDKPADVARRHNDGYEQKENDMEPFA